MPNNVAVSLNIIRPTGELEQDWDSWSLLNPPAGVQQHGASVTAGAQSHNLCVPPGAQGPAGGQGDQEREPGQLQHERQELEDRIPRDVSPS